jgi:hypothetical protein
VCPNIISKAIYITPAKNSKQAQISINLISLSLPKENIDFLSRGEMNGAKRARTAVVATRLKGFNLRSF